MPACMDLLDTLGPAGRLGNGGPYPGAHGRVRRDQPTCHGVRTPRGRNA